MIDEFRSEEFLLDEEEDEEVADGLGDDEEGEPTDEDLEGLDGEDEEE